MFNDTIVSHFSNPTHAGELADASAMLELGNPVCGDRIRVQVLIRDGVIARAAYSAWGCATSLATGNIFCARIEGQGLEQIAAIPRAEVAGLLGELEPEQHHCLEMLHNLVDQLRDLIATREAG